jgi:hypothetical protein
LTSSCCVVPLQEIRLRARPVRRHEHALGSAAGWSSSNG